MLNTVLKKEKKRRKRKTKRKKREVLRPKIVTFSIKTLSLVRSIQVRTIYVTIIVCKHESNW